MSKPHANIPFHLRPAQQRVMDHPARFKVLISGRRFGKTVLAVDLLLKHAACDLRRYGAGFENQTGLGRRVWYVAPSYRMAREISWSMLKQRLSALQWGFSANETSLTAEITQCGSAISLKGADNPDSLRGVGLHYLVMDEFADIKKEAWFEVLRPTLSDTEGHALFCGTPKGFNWAFDLFQKGENKNEPDWKSWQFTTLDGGNVPESEIIAARRDMDERTFRQEYLAGFETFQGIIYYNFDVRRSVKAALPEKREQLHVGIDFNIDPMTGIVCVIRENTAFVVDEIFLCSSNTHEMAEEIKRRYPNRKIRAYPDPSGKARKTSAAGTTDMAILENAGFAVHARPRHPAVRDRINAVNARFKTADGLRHLFVSPNCPRLIEALKRQVYKEKTGIPDKSAGFDHPNDALGYFVEYLWPINGGNSISIEV